MTTFPPDEPQRDDETPAEERAEEEQASVDEPIPETPAEDQTTPDARLADETPDDAETTPLEDARTVEAEEEATEAEPAERADRRLVDLPDEPRREMGLAGRRDEQRAQSKSRPLRDARQRHSAPADGRGLRASSFPRARMIMLHSEDL